MIFLSASCAGFALFVFPTFNLAGALAFSLAHAPGPDADVPRRAAAFSSANAALPYKNGGITPIRKINAR
jgi:hypothetical protein